MLAIQWQNFEQAAKRPQQPQHEGPATLRIMSLLQGVPVSKTSLRGLSTFQMFKKLPFKKDLLKLILWAQAILIMSWQKKLFVESLFQAPPLAKAPWTLGMRNSLVKPQTSKLP